MPYKPIISVIIPAYNAAGTIQVCLQSLLVQTYPAELIEIIVVNDGSADDTSKIISSAEFQNKIIVLDNGRNLGLSATRNKGYRKAKGDIIISLDSDMTVEPSFVSRHVAFHQKEGVVGVIGKLNPGPAVRLDKFQKYLYQRKRGAARFATESPIPYYVFLFGLCSIKKEVLEKVGLQDEKITTYGGEDTEFAYRIWQQYPAGLFYAPEINVYHNHYRKFSDHLNNLRSFGEQVAPYLVARHPEIARAYGLNYLSECQPWLPVKSNSIKLMIGFVLKKRWCFNIIRFFQKTVPFPLSNFWTRLCIIAALFQGAAKGFRFSTEK